MGKSILGMIRVKRAIHVRLGGGEGGGGVEASRDVAWCYPIRKYDWPG